VETLRPLNSKFVLALMFYACLYSSPEKKIKRGPPPYLYACLEYTRLKLCLEWFKELANVVDFNIKGYIYFHALVMLSGCAWTSQKKLYEF